MRPPGPTNGWATSSNFLGNQEATGEAYRQALGLFEKLATDDPDKPEYQKGLANSHSAWGGHVMNTGHAKEAEIAFRRATALGADLVAKYPNVRDYRFGLANDLNNLAFVLMATGRPDAARDTYLQGLRHHEKLAADFPDVPDSRRGMAKIHHNLGCVAQSLNQPQEAEREFRRALAIEEELVFHPRGVPIYRTDYRYDLAMTLGKLGTVLEGTARAGEAEKAYRQALAYYGKLTADFPSVPIYQDGQRGIRRRLWTLLQATGRHREAAEQLGEILKQGTDDPGFLNDLAWFLATCPDPSLRDPRRAVELARKAVAQAPKAGAIWNTLGVAHYRAGDWDDSVHALKKSMELNSGGDASDWFFLAMAHWQMGNKTEARKWHERASRCVAKSRPNDEELLRFRAEAESVLGRSKEAIAH